MTGWVVGLPVQKPLNLNARPHWAARARDVAELRTMTEYLFRYAHVPPLGRCEVRLTFIPPDRRRRDADNLVATLKPVCDGIVDAGIVADDTPDLMRKLMPEIGPPQQVCVNRLIVEVTEWL